MDQPQTRTTGSRETSINQVVEISTEKGVMIIIAEGQTLKTVAEVLEGEPTEISIQKTKMAPNPLNGMHNSKLMVSMGRQY